MKRKDYQKPTMQVVKLQQRTHLLQASVEVQAQRNSYEQAVENWE